MTPTTKWLIAATAPDQLTAEMWRALLVDFGIPARLRAGDTTSFLGVSPMPCRVLVPEGHIEEAEAFLASQLGTGGGP